MVSVSKLESLAAEDVFSAGRNMFSCGGVRIIEQSNQLVKCLVTDTPRREVHLTAEGLPR